MIASAASAIAAATATAAGAAAATTGAAAAAAVVVEVDARRVVRSVGVSIQLERREHRKLLLPKPEDRREVVAVRER